MPRKKSTEDLAADLRPLEELSLKERLERLDARDKHPDLHLAAQDRARAIEQDRQDREAARDSWIRNGGDPKDFDREWKAISNESKRLAMLEEQRTAREGFARYEAERF